MNTKEKLQAKIQRTVRRVKAERPMVGSITNTVTINFVANAQLACGGSAAMVYLPDEAEFLAGAAAATYINVGTLEPIYAETLPRVAAFLHTAGKPWVLDPVAIGIGQLRTEFLLSCKEYKPDIIRGNASEIIALAGLWQLEGGGARSKVQGVDSSEEVSEAKDAAIALARHTGGAVAVSGATDLVTDGKIVCYSYGGSHFMEKVTGCGCSLGGVCGVYLTAADPLIGALTATQIYNWAGTKAQAEAQGPAGFQMHFIDALYQAGPEDVAGNKFEVEEV